MAFVYVDRARMTSATTGTGAFSLGAAVPGFQSFSAAGASDGDTFRYVIEDGDAWEIGTGTLSGSTVVRALIASSTGSLLDLSGGAVMFIGPVAGDAITPAERDAITAALPSASLDTARAWDTPQRLNPSVLESGSTITMDVSATQAATLSLGHDATLDFENMDLAIGTQGRIAGVNTIANPTLVLGTGLFPVGGAAAPALPTEIGDKFRIDFDIVSATRADVLISSVGV